MKKFTKKQFDDFCEKNEISCGRLDINDDDFCEEYYLIDNAEKMEAIKSTGLDFYYCCGYKYDCFGSETYMYCRNYDHFDPEDYSEETGVELYGKGQIKDIKSKIKELNSEKRDYKNELKDEDEDNYEQCDYLNEMIDETDAKIEAYKEAIDSVRTMKTDEKTAVYISACPDDNSVYTIGEKTYGFEDDVNNYEYFVMAFLRDEIDL